MLCSAEHNIDKGQLFKFIGQDKLDMDYHPNAVHGAGEPYYNTVMRLVNDGKLPSFDPAHTLAAIRQVETIPDELFRDLLRPYAERRFKGNPAGLKGFYESALARKNGIRKDFEGYYAKVLKQPGFTFDAAEHSAKKAVEQEAKAAGKFGRLGPQELALLDEARKAGWQGKVIPLDSDQVEDQNMLSWVELLPDGKERSVLSMKIRPEAEKAFLKTLTKGVVVKDMPAVAFKVGQPVQEDADGSYFNAIVAGTKTLGTHHQDGNYNQNTLTKMKQTMVELKGLLKHADPDVAAMAKAYINAGEDVLKGVQANQKLDYNFQQYLRKAVPKPPKREKAAKDFVVRKVEVRLDKKQVKRGQIHVQKEGVSNSEAFGYSELQKGIQYTAEFPDGMEIQYRPWAGANHYAQRGNLEVRFKGPLNPEHVESALERLEKLGIKAQIASPIDAELMYLQKQAYILKRHTSPEYANLVSGLQGKQASKEEWVTSLRGYWGKQLGVKDVTALPGYNPQGEWQDGFVSKGTKAGYRHQKRFDLSEEEVRREMKDYRLLHSLTNGGDMAEFIDLAMGNNGAMVSTVEKLRMGVEVGGMSPKADMNSGGATYFFTRIRKRTDKQAGLYFKIDMLRRMDAISYGSDKYGKTNDDSPTNERHSTPKDWKNIAGNYSNETIFKYSVTLLDNLEEIVVPSEAKRKQVIDAFKKHGVTKMDDGRKVEDIVRAIQ